MNPITRGAILDDGGIPLSVNGRSVLIWYADEQSEDEAIDEAMSLYMLYVRGLSIKDMEREAMRLAKVLDLA